MKAFVWRLVPQGGKFAFNYWICVYVYTFGLGLALELAANSVIVEREFTST